MNSVGNLTTNMAITSNSITCASIGYVESKGSGECTFEASSWGLSYTDSYGHKGATGSTWAAKGDLEGNEIVLSNYSMGTVVCKKDAVVCNSGFGVPRVNWELRTKGSIYVSRLIRFVEIDWRVGLMICVVHVPAFSKAMVSLSFLAGAKVVQDCWCYVLPDCTGDIKAERFILLSKYRTEND